VWSTDPSPTVALSTKISNGNGLYQYLNTITGLTAGTKYFVRSYATNASGTGYGPEVTFTTLPPVVPIVFTSSIAKGSTSAEGGGEITGDGGSPIVERGVVWNTSPSPTISLSTKSDGGAGFGAYSCRITGLSPSTTYYVRAYATNATGTGYGAEQSFTTTTGNPLHAWTTDVRVDRLSVGPFPWDPPGTPAGQVKIVTARGEVTDDGGSFVEHRGFEYGTNPDMTGTSITDDGKGVGEFERNMTPLLVPGITYYVRVYANTGFETVRGQTVSITVPFD
jgi:hypothetical protein